MGKATPSSKKKEKSKEDNQDSNSNEYDTNSKALKKHPAAEKKTSTKSTLAFDNISKSYGNGLTTSMCIENIFRAEHDFE